MTIEEVARDFTDLGAGDVERFNDMAAAVFAFQQTRCAVYGRYIEAFLASAPAATPVVFSGAAAPGGPRSKAEPGWRDSPAMPPFLPVEAFKHARITTFDADEAEVIFESSGTGRGVPAKHYVRDLRIYERSIDRQFTSVFGEGPFVIVAHLPHYARSSSLVYMVRHLVGTHGQEGSGFFLDDREVLRRACDAARSASATLILFGAAFGLLDLVEHTSAPLPHDAIVIETGGMKTHRLESTRVSLHKRLASGFSLDRLRIRSEYGMCELLSQCYTSGGEVFVPPPWMRFAILDPLVPSRVLPDGESGALAVIDLANLYSCSFLLTGDRAVQRDGGFEVLGRLTGAELRGCNFLMENA